MSTSGRFYGVGVGPGEPGLIPIAAAKALKTCDIIFIPRAKDKECSIARACLGDFEIPNDRWREVEFTMEADRSILKSHYAELGRTIASELRKGQTVAYLTLGDPSLYSTYGYTLSALLEVIPDLDYKTFPGINSFSAVAAATNWPLGEGRERVLILPCPDEMSELRKDIETHDIVVLMKIGRRLQDVYDLIKEMGIENYCAFGKRVGMNDQVVLAGLGNFNAEASKGYLSILLIRKNPREKRHL